MKLYNKLSITMAWLALSSGLLAMEQKQEQIALQSFTIQVEQPLPNVPTTPTSTSALSTSINPAYLSPDDSAAHKKRYQDTLSRDFISARKLYDKQEWEMARKRYEAILHSKPGPDIEMAKNIYDALTNIGIATNNLSMAEFYSNRWFESNPLTSKRFATLRAIEKQIAQQEAKQQIQEPEKTTPPAPNAEKATQPAQKTCCDHCVVM